MPETSTKKLAGDVDTAIRDAYHALRTALHKVEDLKMKIIQQPDSANPFGAEHDEMYKMYLDLSKRFQTTREEIRDRSGQVQPRPPTPGPAPRADESCTVKPPVQRSKSRPYVLVPVGFVISSLYIVKGRFSSIVAAKFNFQHSRPAIQWEYQST
jgi:hypothetical protein